MEGRLLRLALLASLALHLAVLLGLPELIEAQRNALFPGPLNARLVPSPAPKPQAELPQPGSVAAPAATKRPAVVASKPAPAPSPSAAAIESATLPTAGARPEALSLAPALPANAPAQPVDTAGIIARYRIALMEAARGLKAYPRVARENNWQGRVEVRVRVGAGGAPASLAVTSGSGHAVLDEHAVDMIRGAQARTPLPADLRQREFTIDVPVVFGLNDG